MSKKIDISKKPETPLRAVTKYLGITQKKLAESIGREPSYFSKMVTGKRNISIDVAEEIHNIYHISLDYLYGKSNAMMDEASTTLKNLSDIFSEITLTTLDYNEDEYLMFSMDEYLYKFLMEVVKKRILKENGEMSVDVFNNALAEIKKEYLKNKSTGQTVKCVLIPSKDAIEIVEEDAHRKKELEKVQLMLNNDNNSKPKLNIIKHNNSNI